MLRRDDLLDGMLRARFPRPPSDPSKASIQTLPMLFATLLLAGSWPIAAWSTPSSPPAAAPLVAIPVAATPTVLWEEKHHRVDKLPEDLVAGAREEIGKWATWAEENDMSMALTDDQTILFISDDKNLLKDRLDVLYEAQEKTETLLFGKGGRKAFERERAKREATPTTGELSDPAPKPPADSIIDYSQGTITIFEVADRLQMKEVLTRLASDHEYIRSWLAVADSHTGFTFEVPLVGLWLETPEQEEWDPNAELINRAAQLLVTREYGPMPYWLRMGIAWNVEFEMLDGLWCFPYRSEFVFTTEHTAWPSELKDRYADRDEFELQPDEFMDWQERSYNGDKGRVAFGVVHFLAEHQDKELPNLLAALRDSYAVGSVEVAQDGSWKRKGDYKIPLEEQQKLMIAGTRADLMPEVTTYLRKGLKYTPRKVKN